MSIKECEARQYSDQKVCNRCGLVWDMNDPDPPPCKTDSELRRQRGLNQINKLRKQYGFKNHLS